MGVQWDFVAQKDDWGKSSNTLSDLSQPQSQALSPFPPVPQRKLKEENKRNTGIEVGFLPGALGDVIAVICAPATSLTSVTGIDSFGTIGISR